MIIDDRFGYEGEDDEKDDDEKVDDEKDDEELCYQTPSPWELPPRDNVLKAAKSIVAYTLNVLIEKGKGPITSSEMNDVERITSLALELVGRAYDIYKQRVGVVVKLFPIDSSHSKESGVYFLQRSNDDSKVGSSERKIRIRVKEQTENHGSCENVAASVIMTTSMMQEMFMSDPIIPDLVTRIMQLSPLGQCHDDKQERHKLTFLTQCIELLFMAARPGSNTDVIGLELPVLCGSAEIRDMYSTTITTPNSIVVDILEGSADSETFLHFLNTWITCWSKIMEQLVGCDDDTKALVLATVKDKAEGYTKRCFQQLMVGGLQTTATNAVTTCPAYTKLLEVCNEIKDVLENNVLDAEQKNEQILELLSTINEDSKWKSPYDSSRPDDVSWMANTKQHLLNTFELARETLRTSPNANLVYIMEAEYFKHIPVEILEEYFTSQPISLFDKNPHHFTARLYRVKLDQDQCINMIVMDCSFFSPFAIQSSSSATTRIKSSASLVAVTHVLAAAGIVSSDVLSKMHGLLKAFGIGVEGRFIHGSVSKPAGVVEAACHLVTPMNYGVNPYEPGTQEIANTLTRKFGDTYSLSSHKIHKLYAVAIIQILGVDRVGNWLLEIHNITVPLSDPSLLLHSMQQQGRENRRKRTNEALQAKRQAIRAERASLEQLVADGEELNDVQLARLEELRTANEIENETRRANDRLRYHEKRVERETLEKLVADGEELAPEKRARLDDLQSARERNCETTQLRYHEKRKLEKLQKEEKRLKAEAETTLRNSSSGDEEAKAQKEETTAPKERKTTQRWRAEEDEQLAELVGSAPSVTRINWTELAKNMTDRTAKQCRERYTNSLKPNQKKGQWTEEEDSNIMKLQEMFGNQWSKIAAQIPGRSDNDVKNRWNSKNRSLKRRVKYSDAPEAKHRAKALPVHFP